jgi:chromosome segregation ATPase
MKQAVGSFGFVRASRYAAAVEQQQRAESRARKLEQQLEVMRAESKGWKGKADQAHEALREAQAGAAEARKQLQRAEKLRADAEQRAERNAQRAVDMDGLHTRLTESERALAIAREQLMAIEVKLDILEGAANVLDARTRTVVTRRTTTERGAPV